MEGSDYFSGEQQQGPLHSLSVFLAFARIIMDTVEKKKLEITNSVTFVIEMHTPASLFPYLNCVAVQ